VKKTKVLCRACDTENDPDEGICHKCGLSLTAMEISNRECTIICPRCQHTNKFGSFFCYTCGKYFVGSEEAKTGGWLNKRGRRALLSPALKAKIIMPGGAEIILTGTPIFIERNDFDSTLPHELLMSISRQHILITYDKGKYYLKDYGHEGKGSTNHTRLNGIDIYNKRKKALKDGDKIELAGQPELTMKFKLVQESN
jgi:hypothetical protein